MMSNPDCSTSKKMATSYNAAVVVELLDYSDFGFSDSESGDKKDGRMYSYHGKPKLTSIELTSLVASVEDSIFMYLDISVCLG